jgi:hypothetical protein
MRGAARAAPAAAIELRDSTVRRVGFIGVSFVGIGSVEPEPSRGAHRRVQQLGCG